MVGWPERHIVTVEWPKEIHFDLPHLRLSSECCLLTMNRPADSGGPQRSNEATDAAADSWMG